MLKTTSAKDGRPEHVSQPFMVGAIELASHERTLKEEEVGI